MQLFLYGLAICVFGYAFALGGLWLTRRSLSDTDTDAHRNAAGYTVAVAGTIYGVVLGLVVADVWSDYKIASRIAVAEATTVTSIHRNAQHLPPELRTSVTGMIWDYADSVVRREWPAMARGQQADEPPALLNQLSGELGKLNTQNPREQALFTDLLGRLDQLEASRSQRLLANRGHIHGVIWFMLILGAMITIACTWLFRLKHFGVQALLCALLTGTICLNLVLIILMQRPYDPAVGAGPTAMQQALSGLPRR